MRIFVDVNDGVFCVDLLLSIGICENQAAWVFSAVADPVLDITLLLTCRCLPLNFRQNMFMYFELSYLPS